MKTEFKKEYKNLGGEVTLGCGTIGTVLGFAAILAVVIIIMLVSARLGGI